MSASLKQLTYGVSRRSVRRFFYLLTQLAMTLRENNTALEACESMLPYLPKKTSLTGSNSQILSTIEQFLTHYCTLAHTVLSEKVQKLPNIFSKDLNSEYASILKPFRKWAEFWEGNENLAADEEADGESEEQKSRIIIWQVYYNTLSMFIQFDILKPLFESRLQQGLEFKRVEATSERLLLSDTEFPEAGQATPRIGQWIDMVITNWKSMINNGWSDEDVGPGGRAGLSQNTKKVSYILGYKNNYQLELPA